MTFWRTIRLCHNGFCSIYPIIRTIIGHETYLMYHNKEIISPCSFPVRCTYKRPCNILNKCIPLKKCSVLSYFGRYDTSPACSRSVLGSPSMGMSAPSYIFHNTPMTYYGCICSTARPHL